MMPEAVIMTETKAEMKAGEDAYTLVYFQQLKTEDAEIRKSPSRFAAAVKHIKKENEERRKAMQKENEARAIAMKK